MTNGYQARGLGWLWKLWFDLRLGIRVIFRDPLFSTRVVLILAVGTGGSTLAFSVFNAVLLHALPYDNADRLVRIWTTPAHLTNVRAGLSVGDLVDIRDETNVFASLGAYRVNDGMDLTYAETFERLNAVFVFGDFFRTIGVEPVLGRWLLPSDNIPANNQVAVLSHPVWQAYFGSDPDVIGRIIHLDKVPYVVVGVMPPTFEFPSETAEIWLPELVGPGTSPDYGQRDRFAFGRLARDVSAKEAQAELNVVRCQTELATAGNNRRGAYVIGSLQDELVGAAKQIVVTLLATSTFILLLVCANVANLLLARNWDRRRAMAIRGVLGATPGRICQQLLIESLLLAALGAALGLVLSICGFHLLRPIVPATIPRLNRTVIDACVLGFTFCMSMLTGALFGAIPACRFFKQDLSSSLKGRYSMLRGTHKIFGSDVMQRVLVLSQIVLAVILTFNSGLLFRSLARLVNVDIGFQPENLLVIQFSRPTGISSPLFFGEALRAVATVPNVNSSALVSPVPLAGNSYSMIFAFESNSRGWSMSPPLVYQTVSASYFQTMAIPVLKGQTFADRDTVDSPCVAIINRTMELRLWPDEDSLAKRINLNGIAPGRKPYFCTIVGVVGNARELDLRSPAGPEIYFPASQRGPLGYSMVVRTSRGASVPISTLLERIWSIDNTPKIASVKTMKQLVDKSVIEPRFRTVMVGIFGALALAVAAIGVFSVASYQVNQRTHEIGIRMVLGARPSDILQEIVRGDALGILIGIGLGLCGALGVSRVLQSVLFEVKSTDAFTLVVVPLVVLIIGLFAAYLPARRATKFDPKVLLRFE